jgi:hypothetical protein
MCGLAAVLGVWIHSHEPWLDEHFCALTTEGDSGVGDGRIHPKRV